MPFLLLAFASSVFAAACSSAANAQLANCTTTWTACTADENNVPCDCAYARINCANALACDEADTKASEFFTSCEGDCSVCPKARIAAKCAADLEAGEQRFKRCNDGEFPTATLCSCAKDFKAIVQAGEAACGSEYTNKLTEIGFSEALGCSADGLKLCTPYESKLIGNWTDQQDDCVRTTKVGKVTQVGKLCDCIIALQANLKQINGTCQTWTFLNGGLKLQYDINQCAKNAGTNVVCDEDKLDACSKGVSTCQSAGAGNLLAICPCYSQFSVCLGNNANCPTAFIAQNAFFQACKAVCPATTNCGPEGVMFTLDPTLFGTTGPTNSDGEPVAPGGTPAGTTRVEFVTGPGGQTVTDSQGKPATRIVSDGIGGTTQSSASRIAVGIAAVAVVAHL